MLPFLNAQEPEIWGSLRSIARKCADVFCSDGQERAIDFPMTEQYVKSEPQHRVDPKLNW